MPSPFPGMDPWLEGHVWPDVHHDLATRIKDQLVPQVIPKYMVRIETYIVKDTHAEEDVGIMYPDVEILSRRTTQTDFVAEPAVAYGRMTSATLTIPHPFFGVEVRIPVVEIRDRDHQQLITAIEILSPINKRKPGLQKYREKRQLLHEDGVHLLEIDLLRRGERPFNHPSLPRSTPYFVMLVRGDRRKTDVWAMTLQDKLPILPVPLKAPDPDVRLDLGAALNEVYDRSRYDLSVYYTAEPAPPVFSEKERSWLQSILKEKNLV